MLTLVTPGVERLFVDLPLSRCGMSRGQKTKAPGRAWKTRSPTRTGENSVEAVERLVLAMVNVRREVGGLVEQHLHEGEGPAFLLRGHLQGQEFVEGPLRSALVGVDEYGLHGHGHLPLPLQNRPRVVVVKVTWVNRTRLEWRPRRSNAKTWRVGSVQPPAASATRRTCRRF